MSLIPNIPEVREMKTKHKERMLKFFTNGIIMECPLCGEIHDVPASIKWYKHFFAWGVEGGFWQLIFFSLKFSIIVYAVIQIYTRTLLSILSEPQYQDILKYLIEKSNGN